MLALADTYVAHGGDSLSALSKKIFNDNTFFARMKNGKNFTARSYDRCVAWFDQNWPNNLPWPAAVPRPDRSLTDAVTLTPSDEAA